MASWQRLLLASTLLHLLWDTVGLLANPSFAIGTDATAVQVLGVDFNGWHALAGFLLFGPALFIWRRAELAVPYMVAAIAALLATAVWGVVSERPAGVFYFPNPTGDFLLHVGSAAFLAVLLAMALRTRAAAHAPA